MRLDTNLDDLIFFYILFSDCVDFFGEETIQPIRKDDSVICETQFSKVVPLEDGEVIILIPTPFSMKLLNILNLIVYRSSYLC